MSRRLESPARRRLESPHGAADRGDQTDSRCRARSGPRTREAAALAAVKRDCVDVIILDLHLKQGTGFGVMRALAATPMKPRIIVLTNYDLPEYKNAAIALGATHFLDKARDYGRLPEVLREICEAHLAKNDAPADVAPRG